MKPIGILGGTFDPVHYGHLRLAMEIMQRLDLAELRFVPLRVPPHRAAPRAGPEQRHQMLRLAVAGVDRFRIDERELHREGVSYTIDTLISLRGGSADTPYCLLMGMDAFRDIETWHRWKELLDYAHIVIADRPGTDLSHLPATLRKLAADHGVADYRALHQARSGGILHVPLPLLDISSTQIRQQIADGNDVRFLLPDAVIEYIQVHHLYRNLS